MEGANLALIPLIGAIIVVSILSIIGIHSQKKEKHQEK